MKKFLKSVGICLGLMILNQLIIGLVSGIGAIFIKDANKIGEKIYILAFIRDLITLTLVHFMYSIYNKKLLSKNLFKKINLKDIVYIILFGIAHGNIVQGIYTFILGIALALVYVCFNSLWGSIILHIIFNFMGLLIIPKIVSTNPSLIYVLLIIGIACLLLSLFKVKKKYEHFLYN